MKLRWDKLGGQIGLGFMLLGLLVVFLGWNGAASIDRVPSQFPYLISGGIVGLCLVVIGVGLMIVQNQREDRARLQGALDELRQTLERSVGTGPTKPAGADGFTVVAGPSAYHRLSCRLLEGRSGLEETTVAVALERGLRPCRTCAPPSTTEEAEQTAEIPPARPRRRPRGGR